MKHPGCSSDSRILCISQNSIDGCSLSPKSETIFGGKNWSPFPLGDATHPNCNGLTDRMNDGT